ncbi:MAG: SIR2 family protein [Pseudomonadota bacterium]
MRGLHQILISDKKRLGFLFGAGTSLATSVPGVKVPAIAEMTKIVSTELGAASKDYKTAIAEIEVEIGSSKFNVESLLSCIEGKRAAIGKGNLNGLDAKSYGELSKALKKAIVQLVSVHEVLKPEDRHRLAHSQFSTWVSKARRRHPAEIFTTNYDYLFEIALEGSGIPYFDGFSGAFEPFFCPEAVEDLASYAQLAKLWKMHGSLGWTHRASDKTVIRKGKVDDDSILIYPSHLKYSTSKKQPYVGLIDRLCSFLQQDDAVLITCGYSFGDEHINERILTSLRRSSSSHVVALYFDESGTPRTYALVDPENSVRKMAERDTAGRLSVYGRRHAVIGGKFGEWRLGDEPSVFETSRIDAYFDEDAAQPIAASASGIGDERWAGTGRFLLPDFGKLSAFLNDMAVGSQTAATT